MTTDGGQLGASTLHLLAGRGSVRLLAELTAARVRPSDLGQRLADLSHAALGRLLDELANIGAIAHDRVAGVPPSAWYKLTDAGRELLAICAAAERWERRWSSLARGADPGVRVMRLMADEANRTILVALADEALPPREIDRHLPDLARSAARRRLAYLLANGVLTRPSRGQDALYALTPAARRLPLIGALAARWEVEWRGRDGIGNVPGLLRLLAPAAQIPEPVNGLCRLQIAAETPHAADVYICARDGALTALPDPPTAPPHAHGQAPAHVWRNAILDCNPAAIVTCGNTGLMVSVLMSVSTALFT